MTEMQCNHFDDRKGCDIRYVVLHYTETRSVEQTFEIFELRKVSAHYVVGVDGAVYQGVDEAMRAWHAGEAFWQGRKDINGHSIGVELQNDGESAFPAEQMAGLAELLGGIWERHGIRAENLLAHSDVAPARKVDPGALFDWKWLAEQGFGLFPDAIRGSVGGDGLPELLTKIGYGGCDMEACVEAFQRRYRTERIDGLADAECSGLAESLLQKIADLP